MRYCMWKLSLVVMLLFIIAYSIAYHTMQINFRSSSRKPPLESEFSRLLSFFSRLLSMGNNVWWSHWIWQKFLEMLWKVLHLITLLYWLHRCLFWLRDGIISYPSLNNKRVREKYISLIPKLGVIRSMSHIRCFSTSDNAICHSISFLSFT